MAGGWLWTERPYGADPKCTHYTCKFCTFGALSERSMRAHLAQHHRRELERYNPPAEPTEPATVSAEEE